MMGDGGLARFVVAVEDVSGLWPTVKTVSASRAVSCMANRARSVLTIAHIAVAGASPSIQKRIASQQVREPRPDRRAARQVPPRHPPHQRISPSPQPCSHLHPTPAFCGPRAPRHCSHLVGLPFTPCEFHNASLRAAGARALRDETVHWALSPHRYVLSTDARLLRLKPYAQSPVTWFRNPYAYLVLVSPVPGCAAKPQAHLSAEGHDCIEPARHSV